MSKLRKYDRMMHEFCVGQGWCGGIVDGDPKHVNDFLPKTGTVSSEQFVTWLMLADGYDSDLIPYSIHRKTLVAIFEKHMHATEVDVSELRSSSIK